jgi:hypothetical protein
MNIGYLKVVIDGYNPDGTAIFNIDNVIRPIGVPVDVITVREFAEKIQQIEYYV